MTLTEFLLARIAEDQAMALQSRGIGGAGWAPGSGGIYWADSDTGELHIDPDRVLAECEAKRRIVEECVDALGEVELGPQRRILCHLATVYADHPDCREEWKP